MSSFAQDLNDRLVLLVNENNPLAYNIWEPENTLVVLGHSNIAEDEVYSEQCAQDNICVRKRRGGGGAVVLAQGMLVISIAKCVHSFPTPLKWLRKINSLVIDVLEGNNVKNLFQRGISDICIDVKKILGSSLYLPKGRLLYQASLLVNCDLTTVERYLRHPRWEPDYRQGRSHREFLTTLWREGYTMGIGSLKRDLQEMIYDNLR